jgi:hypothetical protein
MEPDLIKILSPLATEIDFTHNLVYMSKSKIKLDKVV